MKKKITYEQFNTIKKSTKTDDKASIAKKYKISTSTYSRIISAATYKDYVLNSRLRRIRESKYTSKYKKQSIIERIKRVFNGSNKASV
jgi:hypothetical protein